MNEEEALNKTGWQVKHKRGKWMIYDEKGKKVSYGINEQDAKFKAVGIYLEMTSTSESFSEKLHSGMQFRFGHYQLGRDDLGGPEIGD